MGHKRPLQQPQRPAARSAPVAWEAPWPTGPPLGPCKKPTENSLGASEDFAGKKPGLAFAFAQQNRSEYLLDWVHADRKCVCERASSPPGLRPSAFNTTRNLRNSIKKYC